MSDVLGLLGAIVVCWLLYEIIVLTGSQAFLGRFPSLLYQIIQLRQNSPTNEED